VSAAKVLHERMPRRDHSGATVLLDPSHRLQPCLQPAVVTLDPVVGIAVSAVPCRWQQFL
jgi:hypothetical protein